MADRPIIFSGPMVSALLAGRKTQTRRVGQMKPGVKLDDLEWSGPPGTIRTGTAKREHIKVPHTVGDCLWVRETACIWDSEVFYKTNEPGVTVGLGGFGKWTPSIFMPRWASRLTLTVTDVRVQRLQEITEQDALDEGMWRYGDFWNYRDPSDVEEGDGYSTPRNAFRFLWEGINADRGFGWETNPWVVAVSFTVQRGNIDQVPA